jgi:hypothetical protein
MSHYFVKEQPNVEGAKPGIHEALGVPVDHGTGSRSQILIEATSMVPW